MPQWLRDYASRQRAARGGEVTTGAPLRVLGCSGGQQWADPASLEELLALMAQWRGQGFRLVAGNTGGRCRQGAWQELLLLLLLRLPWQQCECGAVQCSCSAGIAVTAGCWWPRRCRRVPRLAPRGRPHQCGACG